MLPFFCLYLTHLDVTYRHPQGVSIFLFSFALGPLEVNGLSHLWVIVCFSGPSSFLYRIAGFTFPDAPTDSFPLNLFRGWPKFQTVLLQPMLAGSMSCLTWQLSTSLLQVLIVFYYFLDIITHVNALYIYAYVSYHFSILFA